MINLIIKGNMFDAFTASHARGIALLTAAQQFREGPFSDVVASCDDANLDAVRAWFIACDGPAPYPAGALLFYSDKQSAAYNDERAAPPLDSEPRKACVNTLQAHLAQGNRATRRALAADRRLPTEVEAAAWRREHGE
jgi:hypothetical protein